MPIKTEITGWKKVYKDGLPSFWHKKIENSLTFSNPAYEGMKTHRPHVLRALEKTGDAPFPILRFFRQTEDYYLVPRHFSLGDEEVVVADQRCRVSAEFPEPNFDLWDIQADAIETWKESRSPNGVIVIPTGSGKCILGMEIVRRLKQKTLVLVDRDKAGAGNWLKDCKAYLGIKAGRIQGKNIDLDPPIVVGTFQTLNSRRDLLKDIRREFGCIIVDECITLDALISTPDGDVPFDDINPGRKIWSFNWNNRSFEEDYVIAESLKEDSVYEVVIEVDGDIKTVRCGANHPFFRLNGSEVKAIDLKPNDKVLTA